MIPLSQFVCLGSNSQRAWANLDLGAFLILIGLHLGEYTLLNQLSITARRNLCDLPTRLGL